MIRRNVVGIGALVAISVTIVTDGQVSAVAPPEYKLAQEFSNSADGIDQSKRELVTRIVELARQGKVIQCGDLYGVGSHMEEIISTWGRGQSSNGEYTYPLSKVKIFSDLDGTYGSIHRVMGLEYFGDELQNLTREDVRRIAGDATYGYPFPGYPECAMHYELDGYILEFQYDQQARITAVLVTDIGECLGSYRTSSQEYVNE